MPKPNDPRPEAEADDKVGERHVEQPPISYEQYLDEEDE
jgi:hypothetical protein